MDDDNDADHFLLYLILFTHLEKTFYPKQPTWIQQWSNLALLSLGMSLNGIYYLGLKSVVSHNL